MHNELRGTLADHHGRRGRSVATGVVANLARPGGNITGMAGVTAELAGKNVELVREMLPSAKRFEP